MLRCIVHMLPTNQDLLLVKGVAGLPASDLVSHLRRVDKEKLCTTTCGDSLSMSEFLLYKFYAKNNAHCSSPPQ